MNNFRKTKALTKIILKTFLKQPMGIIMSLIAPSILMVLIPFLINGLDNAPSMKNTLATLAPGLMSIPSLMIGLIGIPLTYSTLKETSILKKFKIAGVKPLRLILVFTTTFMLIILFATFFEFSLTKMIWQNDAPNPASASIIIPWILNASTAIFIGLIVANRASSSATAFAIGIAIFLPTIFLSGAMFPKMSHNMNLISQIIPQHHTIRLFTMCWNTGDSYIHSSVPGMNDALFESVWKDTVTVYTYPSLFILASITLLTFRFKWE